MHDLCITEILNVYSIHQQMNWKRDFFAPRHMDGIVLFTEGKIAYHFAGKELTAQQSDLLFLPGNLPYSGNCLSGSVSFFVLNFRCLHPDDFERLGAPAVLTLDDASSIHAQFTNAVAQWNRQPLHGHLSAKAFTYSLLSSIFQRESAENGTAPVDAVIAYILEHLSDPSLTVSRLCEVFFISESQLRRNLFKATGLVPSAYILALRINRAKKDLVYTHQSIQQIAARCGFASPFYFSRCFHESTGLSPSDYRKKYNTI